MFSGFENFQPILFPTDHTNVADNKADKLRLVIIHYDKECGAVGAGDRLNFAKTIFNIAGVNQSPRSYRNNLAFLLAECTRVEGLKDAVRDHIGWDRVKTDLETEQRSLAEGSGQDYRVLQQAARHGAVGVPAEFLALEDDKGRSPKRSARPRSTCAAECSKPTGSSPFRAAGRPMPILYSLLLVPARCWSASASTSVKPPTPRPAAT